MHTKNFLFLLNFLGIFICTNSSYEWDENNVVLTFAKFVDDIYTEYKNNNKLELFMKNSRHSSMLHQKRAVFNLTFVKCAAEIAHFHVINKNDQNTKEAYQNLNVLPADTETRHFLGFLHYDQSLGHKIAKKFNEQILFPEIPIAETVVHQILQLTFSFAVRVLLSVIYDNYFTTLNSIGRWQLKIILTAYKNLSKDNNKNNNENGIFPFQIIQIDEKGQHLWAQSLYPLPFQSCLKYSAEQLQYIQNFKFILKLSEFKLSYYEIYKLFDAIMNKLDEKEKSPPIYTFMKKHFRNAWPPLAQYFSKNSKKMSKMDCAMITFGRVLAKYFEYSDFKVFAKNSKTLCADAHKKHGQQKVDAYNTPAKGSMQPEMKLFKEPLWNYAELIGIDANQCNAGLLFCEDLQSFVDSALKWPSKNKKAIENLTELKAFEQLRLFISRNNFYEEPHDRLHNYWMKIKGKTFAEKADSLPELSGILQQIHADFSRANKCVFTSSRIMLTHWGRETSKFGQILFEILKKHFAKVTYDEKRQLLTMQLSSAEQFIQRLSGFVESNINSNSIIGDDFDFVKTVHFVASMREESVAENRQISIWSRINLKLFELLFSLAIRLCLLIGQNEYLEKYLPTFLFALKVCQQSFEHLNFFDYKLDVDVERGNVQINIPDWNLPYQVYRENDEKLNVENVEVFKENFNFMLNLSNYSPTIYEVIKMAQILYEMPSDDQDWVMISPSESKILHIFIEHLENIQKINNIHLSTKTLFCILTHFVTSLLAKAKAAKQLPTIDIVNKFEKRTKNLCVNWPKEEIVKNFGENIINFSKMIKLDLNLNNDILQILLLDLTAELEERLANENFDCINLRHVKLVEFKFLELALDKSGQSQKWAEIQNLLMQCEENFEKLFKQNEMPKLKEMMEEVKEMLAQLKKKEQLEKKEEEKESVKEKKEKQKGEIEEEWE